MTGERKRFYKRPIFYIPAIVVAVPALWLAWWLGSPLFLNKTVIEAFPTVSTEATPAPAVAATDPPAAFEQPPALEVVSEPAAIAPTTSAVGTTEAPVSTVAAEPVALLAGMFKDADSSHKGSGDATIYELEDGTLVLRLEGIDITNGPDLHVFLAPVADASEREDVMADGYLDLGALKGNRGDQNYIILGNFDPDRDWTVVVYCVPFHVIFSTAPLA